MISGMWSAERTTHVNGVGRRFYYQYGNEHSDPFLLVIFSMSLFVVLSVMISLILLRTDKSLKVSFVSSKISISGYNNYFMIILVRVIVINFNNILFKRRSILSSNLINSMINT